MEWNGKSGVKSDDVEKGLNAPKCHYQRKFEFEFSLLFSTLSILLSYARMYVHKWCSNIYTCVREKGNGAESKAGNIYGRYGKKISKIYIKC